VPQFVDGRAKPGQDDWVSNLSGSDGWDQGAQRGEQMTMILDDEVADLRRKLDESRAERDAALAREAALAEVLDAINRSPGDPGPVFEAILEKAHSLCGAATGALVTYDGGHFRAVATHGYPEEFAARLRRPFLPNVNHRRLLDGERFIHIPDFKAVGSGSDHEITRGMVELTAVRTQLLMPLRKDGALLGLISAGRLEVRPFSEREIALLESFADQAVIAIENARLLRELQARTDDLQESLEYQTATSDVLNVISRSTADVQPVLDTMVKTAARLCGADAGGIAIRDGEVYRNVSGYAADVSAADAEYWATVRQRRFVPGRAGIAARVALEGRVVHVDDIRADADYALPEVVAAGRRTALGVPLLRDGEPIGVIALFRQRVESFTQRQIELVRTFADQAVIAIENARLLTELRESLEQQQAIAEVLQVINSSPGDLTPVFETILDKAHILCGATLGTLFLYDGEKLRAAATHGYPEDLAKRLRQGVGISPSSGPAPLLAGARLVHKPDLSESDDPVSRAVAQRGGVRTNLLVPLRKGGALLGVISCNRKEVRPYTDKEIALIENFAARR
jgi:two-component system, NtrC family, sensor kinase